MIFLIYGNLNRQITTPHVLANLINISPASSVIGDGITLIEMEQSRQKVGFSFGEAVAIDKAGLIFLYIPLLEKINVRLVSMKHKFLICLL